MTKDQMRQVLDALELLYNDTDADKWDGKALALFTEALATLQALPNVEVVGVTNDSEISYMQSKEDGFAAMFKVGSERAHNEDGDLELYATKEPS